MRWQGFYRESKRLCAYDTLTVWEKWRWWRTYPRAWWIWRRKTSRDVLGRWWRQRGVR